MGEKVMCYTYAFQAYHAVADVGNGSGQIKNKLSRLFTCIIILGIDYTCVFDLQIGCEENRLLQLNAAWMCSKKRGKNNFLNKICKKHIFFFISDFF
jgi:hypothetical protein